jgi:HD-like signal output (HDOD) protein
MTDKKMPKNADDWADYLAEQALPSPFQVGKRLLNKLQKEKMPYAQIAARINRDPILAFYVLTNANKSADDKTPSSKTLAHAISMIGIEKLISLINAQPFKAISLKNITSFYYLRTLTTSLYAGHLGSAIALKKSKGNSEDIYWSSLFAGAPIWHLWRFATPEMRLVRYAIRSNYKLPKTAEREVLGDTMEDVGRALAKKLDLPLLAQQCYDPEKQLSHRQWIQIARSFNADGKAMRVDDRNIAITMQSPHFIVMLSNLIAHYSSYCWYSRATLRGQRILANFLQCPIEEAIKLTHETAADMSRAHPMPGVMSPAAKLFVPIRTRTKATAKAQLSHFSSDTFTSKNDELALLDDQLLPNASTSSKASTSPKASTSRKASTLSEQESVSKQVKTDANNSPQINEGIAKKPTKTDSANPEKHNAIFEEITHIMSHQPEEFTDLHELMNAATQGIAYGIELKRACVGLINKDATRLKNYYSVGCKSHDELSDFDTQIVPDTIFAKLSARPASIWIKPSSDKKIIDLLPMNFKRAIDVKDFFLMSVFVGKKPVAIFYADNFDDKTLTEFQYGQFKFLCGAVNTALQDQAKRKAAKEQ